VSDALFASVAEYALAEKLPVAIHAAESRAERDLVTSGAGDFAPGLRARGIATPVRGRSTVAMLERLGVLRTRPMLIHCVDVDAGDIQLIADNGCTVAHCPIANARLGHGVAPYGALRDAGVPIGLGTDGVGSNNRLDLLEEARVASLLQRAVHRSPEPLPASELLRLCTIEGARVLGLADQIGTLEPGKQADLCAVSLEAPHVRPVHDPVAALFHAARGADVVLTVVGGEQLYRDGRVRTLDVPTLSAATEEGAERLREALA
jgi:5-methylthioadenosine/S-adenosylhomocysteine deaminase